MAEQIPLTQDEIEELVKYTVGTRTSRERAHWFIGRRFIPDGEEPDLLAESVRGDEDPTTGTWQPSQDERCKCCDKVRAPNNSPFVLLKHCASEEHVRNLITGLSTERQRREYKFMIENIYAALTDDWSDS